MTERVLAALVVEAAANWDLFASQLIHRVSRVLACEPIVWVAVAAPHRDAAFQAWCYLIDFLKTRAPFWKQEEMADGYRWMAG